MSRSHRVLLNHEKEEKEKEEYEEDSQTVSQAID
jgi:hypothetical protein